RTRPRRRTSEQRSAVSASPPRWAVPPSAAAATSRSSTTLILSNRPRAVEREAAIRTYDEALATRETDPSTAAEVIIMQRLHERDITGHVLDTTGRELVHLMLPMEFDERRRCVTGWGKDPRTEDGELLWPEQLDMPEMASDP